MWSVSPLTLHAEEEPVIELFLDLPDSMFAIIILRFA